MAGVDYKPNYSYFIDLKLGKLNLGNKSLSSGSKDPKYIQSMTIIKLGNSTTNNDGVKEYSKGNLYKEAKFTLTTVNDIMLESKILDYIKQNPKEPKAKFQYGYVDGPKSPVYEGVITYMDMTSDFYTITLTIEWSGIADKYSEFSQSTINTICNKTYTKYSSMVTDIANGQGWKIGSIVSTKTVSPESIEKPIISDSPIGFIRDKILPYVVSDSGEGKYQSLFKVDKSGVEKYYFAPTKFMINYKILKNYNFIIRMLPNGQVLSFRPKLVNGVAAAEHLISSKSNSTKNLYGTVTRDTKEVVKIDYSASTKGAADLLNPENTPVFVAKTGVNQNSDYSDAIPYGEGLIKDNFSDFCYSVAINPSAAMEILGDPELNILDLINVVPMYPAESKSSGGVMHPSGGTYMITKITDSISSGGYTTALDLVKMNDTLKISSLSYK